MFTDLPDAPDAACPVFFPAATVSFPFLSFLTDDVPSLSSSLNTGGDERVGVLLPLSLPLPSLPAPAIGVRGDLGEAAVLFSGLPKPCRRLAKGELPPGDPVPRSRCSECSIAFVDSSVWAPISNEPPGELRGERLGSRRDRNIAIELEPVEPVEPGVPGDPPMSLSLMLTSDGTSRAACRGDVNEASGKERNAPSSPPPAAAAPPPPPPTPSRGDPWPDPGLPIATRSSRSSPNCWPSLIMSST